MSDTENTSQVTDLADSEPTQEAEALNPILGIPDQELTITGYAEPIPSPTDIAAPKLAQALKDILPAYWDANHPSADLFAKAKEALLEFQKAS